MLKQGPIPTLAHGLLEYLAAVLLFLAPFIFDFRASAAIAVSIVMAVIVLILPATTARPTRLINQVPPAAHAVIDLLIALAAIAAPFAFGFSAETAPTVFYIAFGVGYLLVAIGTRYVPAPEGEPRRPAAAGAEAGARERPRRPPSRR